jgi:hypothetical protein
LAYDLDGHDQPVWDVVEATGIEPRVLRAHVVPRQLDRSQRVLDRCGG